MCLARYFTILSSVSDRPRSGVWQTSTVALSLRPLPKASMHMLFHPSCMYSIACGINPHNVPVVFAGVGSPLSYIKLNAVRWKRLDCFPHIIFSSFLPQIGAYLLSAAVRKVVSCWRPWCGKTVGLRQRYPWIKTCVRDMKKWAEPSVHLLGVCRRRRLTYKLCPVTGIPSQV